MKVLDSNAIPAIECPMCKVKVNPNSFTARPYDEDIFLYTHVCYSNFTIKDFEKLENYKQEQK